jgi:hypothetical protein
MDLPIRSEDVFTTFKTICTVIVQISGEEKKKAENPVINLFICLRPQKLWPEELTP